jgi:hypothetical protein
MVAPMKGAIIVHITFQVTSKFKVRRVALSTPTRQT